MAVVTFDFDDTLTLPVWSEEDGFWEGSLHAQETILDVLRDLADHGHEIHIVTTRFVNREVQEFVDAHDLPVEGIHFTEGKLKAPTLKELGTALHFDDCTLDAEECQEHDIPFLLVVHPFDRENNEEIDRFPQFSHFMDVKQFLDHPEVFDRFVTFRREP